MKTKFQKGDHVLLNRDGQTQFPTPPFSGLVTSVIMKRDDAHLRVKMDGRKTVQTWSASWFTKLTGPTP